MKFLVTADNNGAIGRGAQPLVTIPAMQQSFLKETQGKVVVMGRKDSGRTSRWTASWKQRQCGTFRKSGL